MRRNLIGLLVLLFFSCWFGGIKRPDVPVPIVFAGIIDNESGISNITSMPKTKLQQSIIAYLNESGFLSVRKIINKNTVISAEDSTIFAQDSTLQAILQLRLTKEDFRVERKTLVPYIANKPKLVHIWEFQVFLWVKGGSNFVFNEKVVGKYTVASHIDVIDYDKHDPDLVIPAPEREKIREQSLRIFVNQMIDKIYKYIPVKEK